MKDHELLILPIQGTVISTHNVVGKIKYLTNIKLWLNSEAKTELNFPGSKERIAQIDLFG